MLFLASIVLSLIQGSSPAEGLVGRALVTVLFINALGAVRQHQEAKRRMAQQGTKG